MYILSIVWQESFVLSRKYWLGRLLRQELICYDRTWIFLTEPSCRKDNLSIFDENALSEIQRGIYTSLIIPPDFLFLYQMLLGSASNLAEPEECVWSCKVFLTDELEFKFLIVNHPPRLSQRSFLTQQRSLVFTMHCPAHQVFSSLHKRLTARCAPRQIFSLHHWARYSAHRILISFVSRPSYSTLS